MRNFQHWVLLSVLPAIVLVACEKPTEPDEPDDTPGGHNPTPYALQIPPHFPPMPIPAGNPMTVEGVELGRHLFYEERLSGNNTMSCASCHLQPFAFSDPDQASTGIDGIAGTRNAMALINLGWEQRFFWDGRAMSLEEQVRMLGVDRQRANGTKGEPETDPGVSGGE